MATGPKLLTIPKAAEYLRVPRAPSIGCCTMAGCQA